MKKYYIECSKSEKVQTSSAQIPWLHNTEESQLHENIVQLKIKSKKDEKRYSTETIYTKEKLRLIKFHANIKVDKKRG